MPYSDNGIDAMVSEIFKEFVGHACDVGANNGTFISNSLMFEEWHWTVLCVEPNPLLAEEGRSKRKLWRQVAAASEDCDDRYFNSIGGPPYAASSALYPKGHIGDMPVVARRLDRILEEAGFPKLDYLTVDAEGSERDIMAGFTVEMWKPKVIVLEQWDGNAIIIPGYTIVSRCGFDNLYTRSEP